MSQLDIEEVTCLHNIYRLAGGAHKLDGDDIQEQIQGCWKCVKHVKGFNKVLHKVNEVLFQRMLGFSNFIWVYSFNKVTQHLIL